MVSWYDYPYNYSNGTEVEGLGDFINYVSAETSYWLPLGFIFLIWLAVFGLSLASGSKKALATSSFVAFCFSIYFMRLNIINPLFVIIFLIMSIIGALASYHEKSL